MSLDTTNRYFMLASDLVNYTSKNIFLTGKAGTGKTTFLKHIRQSCAKQMAVIAPTGVAAINAGGSTIHSFFQLPFSPFVPGYFQSNGQGEVNNVHSLISKLKINGDKRKLFQTLELLIIDEISMVRCDMMDAIDTVLKHFRGNPAPFGGVQVVCIGDMHQLPPVISDAEWSILSTYYKSPYFFSSHIITDQQPLFISFEKIYRQSDEKFIQLLNAVRNNDLEESDRALLDKLYNPDFNNTINRAIVLTTHNINADKINEEELRSLNTPLHTFKAKIEGEFYEKYFPAEESLILKVGAQVMFIKNDPEKVKRYFNGKIGIVQYIDEEKITVECNDATTIEVKKEKWENIRYNLNHSTKQIDEDIIGSFTQFPLRLAWAITIHKSQGLTFEKAIIDASAAFSPGQVYVALSRCTGMEGIVLKSRINYQSLKNDPRIVEYAGNISSVLQIESQLGYAKSEHQQKILTDLYNFSACYGLASDLYNLITTDFKSFNDNATTWIDDLKGQIIKVQDVSQRFLVQLKSLFEPDKIPQENELIQQRIMASAKYFNEQLYIINNSILKSTVVTDSKQLARSFNELAFELFGNISEKKFSFECCMNGFDGYRWHAKKKEFRVPSFKVNAYSAVSNYTSEDLTNPALYHKLKTLRDAICNKTGKPVYLVASGQTLTEMCNFLPQNLHELGKINGFGKIRLKEFGDQFLHIIKAYCDEHNLHSQIEQKVVKKIKKPAVVKEKKENNEAKIDSKLISFNLYKAGKSIEEIAVERNFSPQTIATHLEHYVSNGLIHIQELVSKEKYGLIEPLLDIESTTGLAPIKEKLGDEVSYQEIRLTRAWKLYERRKG